MYRFAKKCQRKARRNPCLQALGIRSKTLASLMTRIVTVKELKRNKWNLHLFQRTRVTRSPSCSKMWSEMESGRKSQLRWWKSRIWWEKLLSISSLQPPFVFKGVSVPYVRRSRACSQICQNGRASETRLKIMLTGTLKSAKLPKALARYWSALMRSWPP